MGVNEGIVKDNDGNVIVVIITVLEIYIKWILYKANSKNNNGNVYVVKNVRPTILESPFKVEERSESIPIEELIEFRKKQYNKKDI